MSSDRDDLEDVYPFIHEGVYEDICALFEDDMEDIASTPVDETRFVKSVFVKVHYL